MCDMVVPTEAERDFIHRFGVFVELSGAPRVSGLILGWLLICRPPHQSITELSESLDVSKASVSTVIRQLQQGRVVERHPVAGTRQHYYRLAGGGNWIQIMRARWEFITMGREITEHGLSLLSDDRTHRERLAEFSDFMAFLEKEFGRELSLRWEEFRAERARQRE